jgi:hypothetical protein
MTLSYPLLTRRFWLDDRRRRRDWVGLALLMILAFAFPIRTGATRMVCVALAGIVWTFGLYVFRMSAWARAVFIFAACFGLFAGFGPGRSYDRAALQRAYLSSLRSFTGVKYVWGGENSLGIDCSGLVREGMILATLRQGLVTLNPRLLRAGGYIWWHDCTAAQLGEGYRGRTRVLEETPSLNELDYAHVEPGDIAVTDGGAHTLAYLGDRTWIEADPNDLTGDKVIQVAVPESRNAWLSVPMRILRWRLLDSGPTRT